MKNPSRSVWRSLRGALLLLACSLIVGAGSSPGGLITKLAKKSGEDRSVQIRPVIVRPGLKLEILEIRQRFNDVFEVVLKNAYKKDITAITASADDESLHQGFNVDFSFSESEAHQKLASGATYETSYSPSRVAGVQPQVVVSGVVFSDGTIKGDKHDLKRILDNRAGMKIQLDRINPYLEHLGRVKSSRIRTELRNLRRIAQDLAIDRGDGAPMSSDLEYGLKTGREFILRYLSRLETLLENERIETFYQNGAPQHVRHSGEEDFRGYLPRIQKDFKGLADRL
jgi:hypothetical protein